MHDLVAGNDFVNRTAYDAAMASQPTATLTEEEIGLVRSLALAIAQRLRMILRCEQGVGDPQDCYIHHMYQSCFEISCEVLWRLDVTVAAFANGQGPVGVSYDQYYKDGTRKWYPPFFMLYPDHEVKRLLDQSPSASWPPIENVIEAYLRVWTNYGLDRKAHLPTQRKEVFSTTHPDQEIPMKAFVMNQYAERGDEGYVWTDKIAPDMARIRIWDETDIDWSSVDEEKVLEQTIAIMASLEDENLADLKACLWNLSVSSFGLEVMQKWDGKRWCEQPLEARFLTYDEAMAVAHAWVKEP